MLKAAIVSVALLAALNVVPAKAQDSYGEARSSERAGVVTESKVSQLRARLRLTADQLPLWQPVEAALRYHARAGSSASQVQSVMGTAQPLIQTLTAGQKRSAAAFARSLGISNVASMF